MRRSDKDNTAMKNSQENSTAAIGYFLREIGDAERDTLEERLFADAEFSELFDAVENDLVDEYVRGEMDPAMRAKFESAYLISDRRKMKVATARILGGRIAEPPVTSIASEPRVSLWENLIGIFRIPRLAWAGGMAALLLLGWFAGWLLLSSNDLAPIVVQEGNDPPIQPPLGVNKPDPPFTGNSQPESNVSETNVKAAKPANAKPNKTANAPREKERPKVFAFTLLPPMRSGKQPVLTVPRSAQTVNLRIVHDNEKEFARYQADIYDQNGDVIWSREMLVNEKRLSDPISISVRSSTLKAGAYELKLSGISNSGPIEDIKFYNFTVRRQ